MHVVRRTRARSTRSRSKQHGNELFSLMCVVFVGVALFGMARVMLAAGATEASMRVNVLQEDIKDAQLIGDELEINRSALTVPSRIENIAGMTMQMAEADNVEYMAMPSEVVLEDAGDAATVVSIETEGGDGGVSGVLASFLEMAAGEAQMMLVGDVSLASTD